MGIRIVKKKKKRKKMWDEDKRVGLVYQIGMRRDKDKLKSYFIYIYDRKFVFIGSIMCIMLSHVRLTIFF